MFKSLKKAARPILTSALGLAITIGASGLAQAAAPHVTVRTKSTTLPNSAAIDLPVQCQPGEVATGGGGAVGPGGLTNAYLTTSGLFPSNVVNNPTAWHVIATNVSGAAQPLTVWVLCAR